MDKLGVIVPYRNREEHLEEFKKKISDYLNKQGIPFELIIVHQDDAKLFNRGMLLNIGFTYAEKYDCNYVVFHDVDMIPIDVDYSYSDVPIHLPTTLYVDNENVKETFDEYFGGVTMFQMNTFKDINGYSNKYWGWGYEDTDLLLRCKKKNVSLNSINYKNVNPSATALIFNGVNSYVKVKNEIDLNRDTTIFISFFPDETFYDHTKVKDDFPVFSIPGYDTIITYNSFQRYNFVTFDSTKNVLYSNSTIKPPYKTNMCVTFNHREKIIKVYQDGLLLDEIKHHNRLLNYKKEEYFYLGTNNINSDEKNYFKGGIDTFAVFSQTLTDDEVKNMSLQNEVPNLDTLKLHYDAKFIDNYMLTDLVGNNNGEIFNCYVKKLTLPEYTETKIPHRRVSTFYTLPHEENGFLNNRWKDDNTRWNQLRFHNEVSKNDELVFGDGLSDLQFVEHGLTKENNITHVNVGI